MERKNYNIVFDDEPHLYYLNGEVIPSVSEIMQHSNITGDYSFLDPKYRVRGSFVHDATEKIDAGNFSIEGVNPEYKPFISAYESFLDEHDVEIIESETLLFNDIHIYCGTADRVMIVDGEKYVVDYKTGGANKWHKAQTTFYNLSMVVNGDIKEPLPSANLYLKKDGSYVWKPHLSKDGSFEILPYKKVVESAIVLYWYKRERDFKRIKKMMDEMHG